MSITVDAGTVGQATTERSPRTLRRWRERYAEHGRCGLIDKRFLRPSKRRLPPGQLEQLLRLYRERYTGFNVRHFHQIATREHGVTAAYSFVKQALQAAGFRARGRHRQRREASYYLWRSKFGAMSVSDAKRVKEVETENTRLKKLLAESLLENEVMRIYRSIVEVDVRINYTLSVTYEDSPRRLKQ